MVKEKTKKLYMIGNAHLDPVWLWQWHDGFHEARATFRSAIDRMKEYPDFVFVASQAAIYEWVEKSDPELFAEIQQRVAEGRWKLVGGWWVEPDCNIPAGESFVRQGLYGQRYFKEKFGQTASVGYCIDSFGHNAMLPQILKKSGMPHYVFMRPSPHEKGLPSRIFWWESDDGSRVLTFRIPYEYCSWGKELLNQVKIVASELKDPQNELMCFYGVGNHGGGPTKENIDSIHAMQADEQLPELIFSGPDALFNSLIAQGSAHPVVHEDLQHHASGCYSAHSGVKRWNRLAENRLLAAEKFSSVAWRIAGQPYSAEFGQAWKNVLFNQFHDILAGTSLEVAYDDARNQFGEALAIADRALTYAVQSLAWKINVPPEAGLMPLAVFNPHAWAVKTNVEIEVSQPHEAVTLLDSENQPVPFQFIRSQATAGGRARLCFVADLPPMGYHLYRLVSGAAKTAPTHLTASQTVLSNGRYRLEFNPQTGAIHSLRDLTNQCELIAGSAAMPVIYDDDSDTWSHNVFTFTGQPAGEMLARKLELIESGPVKSVIRVTSEFGNSTLVQEFAMYADLDAIDVAVTVDWREHHKLLKLRFPTNLNHVKATWEIPYGHIERMTDGEEEPGQSWIDLSGVAQNGQRAGISLLNDGKYSFDVEMCNIGMTVLRSPIYAHHMPLVPDPDQVYSFIDQGVQKFNYTILPHAGSWDEAGTVRRAAELNQRPTAVITTIHEGPLPHAASFAAVDQDNVVISVLKKAEDNDDLILRCYETAGMNTAASIHLPAWNRTMQIQLGPCEIKTLRVPQNNAAPVIETNLLEWSEDKPVV